MKNDMLLLKLEHIQNMMLGGMNQTALCLVQNLIQEVKPLVEEDKKRMEEAKVNGAGAFGLTQ